MKSITVKDYIGTNAISMSSGSKIREEINKLWNKSEKITLDFSGVEIFASPFFNASIGSLLKDRTITELQEKLSFEGISDHGKSLLNLVIANAIKFYEGNQEHTNNSITNTGKEL